MTLADRLHCPRCKGRLKTTPSVTDAVASLCCTGCECVVPAVNGIADFVGERAILANDPLGYHGDTLADEAASADLLQRIRAVADGRWPASLGDVLELGCGSGQMTLGLARALGAEVRDLLVVDTTMDMLHACRSRLARVDTGSHEAVLFARLSAHEDAIRDAVADTVAGSTVLPRFGDVRRFLTTVHRVLKPGGRAFFVMPNRRYHQALCSAMAAALVRQHARDKAWPVAHHGVMQRLAYLRQQLVHQDDQAFLTGLRDKHLFDSEALEDLALEVGFATVDVIPLDPDPRGGETARRLCQDAELPDALTVELAPLMVSAGAPFFSLLSRQDSSAFMLLWLTKGIGPRLRTFRGRDNAPAIGFTAPETALGGVPPRWSLEVTARDTEAGIVASVGGWCLVNTDVLWLRLTLDGITRDAPVWRPRPDVHEVLNNHGLYHPLNALCCGLEADLRFDGVHPEHGRCSLHVAVVLANGLIVEGPAPNVLVMDEAVVISQ